MDRRRETATKRGATKGITLQDGGLARAVYGVWADAARVQRKTLRDGGLRGETRRLDERAAGQRGVVAPREAFQAALELARGGVPLAEAVGLEVQKITRTYELAYQHVQQRKPSA